MEKKTKTGPTGKKRGVKSVSHITSGCLLIDDMDGGTPIHICCIINKYDPADDTKLILSLICSSQLYIDSDALYDNTVNNDIDIHLYPTNAGNRVHVLQEFELTAHDDQSDINIRFFRNTNGNLDQKRYDGKQKHTIAYASVKFIPKKKTR